MKKVGSLAVVATSADSLKSRKAAVCPAAPAHQIVLTLRVRAKPESTHQKAPSTQAAHDCGGSPQSWLSLQGLPLAVNDAIAPKYGLYGTATCVPL